ncbi:MAG: hypothetical protein K8M05_40140 [Deltaproteobacteria bacterium]|nr:hypothetical protein [Kofleriaceae bacterium]
MRVAHPVLGLALVWLVAACGETQAPKGTSAPKTAAARAKAEKAEADEDPVSGKGKKWGGWRYQGKRDDCFFLVKRKCYTERAAACEAARCGKKQCVLDGAGPAQVRCE